MIRTAYIHAIPGRMRIHIHEVKGSPAKAREIKDILMGCAGVNDATANSMTGNVLIIYDVNRIAQGDILDRLRVLGYLDGRESAAYSRRVAAAGGPDWSTMVARFALETLFTALIY